MTNTTGKWLIRCLYCHGDSKHAPPGQRRLAGYPDIGRAAFGTPGVVLVHVFHKATLLGVATIFLILAGKFLLEGIGGGGEGLLRSQIDTDEHAWQIRWTVISGCLVLAPVLAFRTIREIAPLAAFGLTVSHFFF